MLTYFIVPTCYRHCKWKSWIVIWIEWPAPHHMFVNSFNINPHSCALSSRTRGVHGQVLTLMNCVLCRSFPPLNFRAQLRINARLHLHYNVHRYCAAYYTPPHHHTHYKLLERKVNHHHPLLLRRRKRKSTISSANNIQKEKQIGKKLLATSILETELMD